MTTINAIGDFWRIPEQLCHPFHHFTTIAPFSRWWVEGCRQTIQPGACVFFAYPVFILQNRMKGVIKCFLDFFYDYLHEAYVVFESDALKDWKKKGEKSFCEWNLIFVKWYFLYVLRTLHTAKHFDCVIILWLIKFQNLLPLLRILCVFTDIDFFPSPTHGCHPSEYIRTSAFQSAVQNDTFFCFFCLQLCDHRRTLVLQN